jgi:hypothetical protein
MTSIYKIYTPDNEALFFNTLTEIRKTFDLSDEEIKNIFYKKVYTTKNGYTFMHY